ncbi:hypothetical protein H8S10_13160 [Clostridium sp. NSJ-49]|uniref:Uncharacterized protein n=1 Tax=Clostridium disporicum TaxID=84024 RepID=A0A174DU18_9CLOT|nr:MULTISPECIES: hypothetical protein [Clostridium]MBC5626407.1 hypothetical protein [Clostridium sp. NSJ-49]MCD2500413.1 hypothetical protein [Clostridium sp. NSJ-145]MDU6340827.1 hypothetical protein [Clostridium sp.]CUO28983.1 Uncharacterised protein [Clostridium disporicum]
MEEFNLLEKFECHKKKIIENIDAAKDMELNKITAILVIDDDSEEVQRKLINWLIIEGYKVSLRREEYNILSIEW